MTDQVTDTSHVYLSTYRHALSFTLHPVKALLLTSQIYCTKVREMPLNESCSAEQARKQMYCVPFVTSKHPRSTRVYPTSTDESSVGKCICHNNDRHANSAAGVRSNTSQMRLMQVATCVAGGRQAWVARMRHTCSTIFSGAW